MPITTRHRGSLVAIPPVIRTRAKVREAPMKLSLKEGLWGGRARAPLADAHGCSHGTMAHTFLWLPEASPTGEGIAAPHFLQLGVDLRKFRVFSKIYQNIR